MKHSNISIFIPHLGCPYNCIFCDQYKITGSDGDVTPSDVYNILSNAKNHNISSENTQIAFFGGSFTAIDKKLMIEFLETANIFINNKAFDSIRISTRPDCINKEILDILKYYNVKTIELGIQSLDNEVLLASKRGYSAEKALEACELIQINNFELGMQIMCGLPKDSHEKDIYTAKKIVEIGCKQVRVYPVLVIKGTKLCEMYKNGEYTPLTIDEAVTTCAKLYSIFRENKITILKMGLHTDSDYIAGPFHPAFGELVRSEVFYNDIITDLNGVTAAEIQISSKFESIAKGNSKRNIIRFKNNGYNINFIINNKLQNDEYILKKSPM